ncbi:hypothetical protein ACFPU1_14745 [Thalassorhabdus alkalitolerans]|uniref:Uncharacterized protein n=1 Tax=Thalassorhabdus alkalitolerans TaxID=2282697 RepID=A0ABW0YRB7_9BACI|nr:hypothetical protein [Bacillus sp. FJAT-44742]
MDIHREQTYCHRRKLHVVHEVSWASSDNTKEITASCTGVDDSCKDCLVVLINAQKEQEGKEFGKVYYESSSPTSWLTI